jgi:hypothetical protein
MRLTKRLLDAMAEALDFRTAGEIGEEGCLSRDYDDARDWVSEQLARRERKAMGTE